MVVSNRQLDFGDRVGDVEYRRTHGPGGIPPEESPFKSRIHGQVGRMVRALQSLGGAAGGTATGMSDEHATRPVEMDGGMGLGRNVLRSGLITSVRVLSGVDAIRIPRFVIRVIEPGRCMASIGKSERQPFE